MTDAPISRRVLLASVAGTLGALALDRAGMAQVPGQAPTVPPDPTKVPGAPLSELGQRSPFERPRRIAVGSGQGSSLAPLQDLVGIVTPADLYFERHHAGVPAIDPQRYKLLIHGMVERPQVFDLDALKRFPAVSRLHFLECSGNGSASYRGIRPNLSPQLIDGLTSTSEWSGVPLALLFREVGVKPGAKWFLAEGEDAAVMSRSIPVEKAWDDALIAYGQNGEQLRPGLGGQRQREVDPPHRARRSAVHDARGDREVHRPAPQRDRAHVQLRDGRQVDHHVSGIPGHIAGARVVGNQGLAWSGRGRVTRVDVSTDAGKTWAAAELQGPVLPKCHTRFR